MKRQQNRTLGAFEKTFWLLDQIDSKDFVLAGEIDGLKPAEEWRKAIDQVQRRHPNLSVKITIDEFSRPVFEHVDDLPIPLRVVHAEDNYSWEQEAEKELALRFDTAKGPLLRAVLVQKPHSTVLILAGNHAVADGTSISYLFRDIIKAVSGQELQMMDPQPSNDDTLGLPEDIAIPNTGQVQSLPNVFKKVSPKISSKRIDEGTSQGILERARLEKTTVHGALCAAALIVSRRMRADLNDRKIELISPICSRRPLKLDDNYGLNITTHAVYFEGEQELSFWEIARLAKAGLEGTDTEEHVKNYINFFRGIVFGSSDLHNMIEILKGPFNQELMVTNLGRVKFDTDFGDLKLKAIYGPMVRSGKGMEQTIGAISSNGSLCLTNTSDNPIPGMLDEMEALLAEACELEQVAAN
ncbi:hypothetical protein GCM10023149_29480 [Mucilaginibacter gynuensis]|uniref:Condensation domain-containing protein n=1 Tax=Mucilaginibacter gynuensis TaxID=1302236 RepID=A0ABP8GLI8_9SPHI